MALANRVSCSMTRAFCSRSGVLTIIFISFAASLLLAMGLNAQCPNTGETKVTRRSDGSGYYFFKFMGDGSYLYFLGGKTFSYNEKDDPGKTFIFIDNLAYEPILFDRASLAAYVQSSKDGEILRAQAKHEQEYFKKVVPSLRITDYGPSARKGADGKEDRLFYLWKKENAPGGEAAQQYLISTVVKGGVAVMSVIPRKGTVSDDDIFREIEIYTSNFNVLTDALCAKVLAAPVAR